MVAEGVRTGIQRSLKLVCPIFHMGVRLGSKSCIEKTSKFASEKFGISLAHRVRTSENRLVTLELLVRNFAEFAQTERATHCST